MTMTTEELLNVITGQLVDMQTQMNSLRMMLAENFNYVLFLLALCCGIILGCAVGLIVFKWWTK